LDRVAEAYAAMASHSAAGKLGVSIE